MPDVVLYALRRRGDPPFPDGTLIVASDGIAYYTVRSGQYVRLDRPMPIVEIGQGPRINRAAQA